MKKFLTLLLALIPAPILAQHPPQQLALGQLIPDKNQLEESLRKHCLQTTQALIEAFKYKQQGQILKYLPAFGYNFITQASQLFYNTAILYEAINDQHSKQAKIKAIQQYMEASFQAELEKLYRHYADLEAEIEHYNQAHDLYQLHQELFAIKQAQYQHLEITPLEFIYAQIQCKKEASKLSRKHTAILQLRNLILDLAKANPQARLYTDREAKKSNALTVADPLRR